MVFHESGDVLPIHFDVDQHRLPLKDFVETALSAQKIVETFNEEILDNSAKLELFVVPPKQGSFLTLIGIVASSVAATWAVMQTDIGKSFIKGLTGQEPAYWAEVAGQKLRARIGRTEDDLEVDEISVEELVPENSELQREITAIVLSELIRRFLEKEYNELRALGFSNRKFRAAYEAKNQFYSACYKDKRIQGISFDSSEGFNITRKDFPKYITELPPKEDDNSSDDWVVEVTYVKATSPNWDRFDKSRLWKSRDENGHSIFFSIDDEAFWDLASSEHLQAQVINNMKVQWAFNEENRRRKAVRVLKVLEFNGEVLSKPLDGEQLERIVGEFRHARKDQDDLFD
ncbi:MULTISPECIES: hypothetical protein [unclassified Thalassospira]|uniref:hypothetical protein n=1 Tax=unclassified Thalassospira TaxID=2648997 RepID=UPI001B092937|nr:hypothetical protein [Thalassospira sp.]MBO6773372.1 hypothetical protein [Thalassospira sp.]